jgi:hypothetical protein
VLKQTESSYRKRASQATTRLSEIEERQKDTGQANDRRRMALVVGVGRQQSYDFYQLLLRRLRIFSSIMVVVLAGILALMLWNLYTAISADRIDELGGSSFVRIVLISYGLPLLASTFSALLLRWRPPATTLGLRAVELFILGAVAAVMLWGMAYPQEWYEDLPISRFSNNGHSWVFTSSSPRYAGLRCSLDMVR